MGKQIQPKARGKTTERGTRHGKNGQSPAGGNNSRIAIVSRAGK